jgi:Fe2+ or Zn2+ uptake regulation protein
MQKTSKDFLNQLVAAGHRLTAVRRLIIDFLQQSQKPATALELQGVITKKLRPVNKTTIYRELELLPNNNIIVEINFGDNKKRYEIAGLAHHHHLICNNCQGVEDVFVDQDLVKLEKKIAKEKNFAIHSHSLEFFGLCRHCL